MLKHNSSALKKVFAVIIIMTMIINCAACGFTPGKTEKTSAAESSKSLGDEISSLLSKAASQAGDAAEKAKDKITDWYKSLDLSSFKKGWEKSVEYMGDAYSKIASGKYMEKVGKAIDKVKEGISSAYGSAKNIAEEAAVAVKKWAADTFNVDTAPRKAPESSEKASYKYFQEADEDAETQARALLEGYLKYSSKTSDLMSLQAYVDKNGKASRLKELLNSVFKDDVRVIPKELLDEAADYLKGKTSSLSSLERGGASQRTKIYQETLKELKESLESKEGTLSYEGLEAAVELMEGGEFSPEDFGIALSQILTSKYILKQASGTETDNDQLKTVLTMAPDLISAAVKIVKDGNINEKDLKELGMGDVLAMSEGEIEGSISNIAYNLCESGKLGASVKDADPSLIGALCCLTAEAMMSGYSLVKGDITAEEYGCLIADKIIITLQTIPASALLIDSLPVTKTLILAGCMAGAVLAQTGFKAVKEVTLAFVNGGGFEAIVPEQAAAKISQVVENVKETVSKLNLKEQLSNLKEFVVSTTSEGTIAIKEIAAKD